MAVNEDHCESNRRYHLLYVGKKIEEEIARIADQKRKKEAEKNAKKIEGYNLEQSVFIHDEIASHYVNYRNMKAICYEKGSAPLASEIKKLFKLYKKAIKLGELNIFPKDTKWDKLTDAAWKVSTPGHEQYLKENQMTITMYDSMTDRKRIDTCLNKVIPQVVNFMRVVRKKLEKSLNKKDVKNEKKAF